ncbi:MAG: SBBP repeat-containing protein [Acidobacteria bacterium]|nr:SBBP repeat-containing protein [Acidobacteriota bacterium]
MCRRNNYRTAHSKNLFGPLQAARFLLSAFWICLWNLTAVAQSNEAVRPGGLSLPDSEVSHVTEVWRGHGIQFEPNVGQWPDPSAKYIARTSAGMVLLQSDGISLQFFRRSAQFPDNHSEPAQTTVPSHLASGAVQLRFAGTEATPDVVGTDRLPGKVNYLLGNEPADWRTGIPIFNKARYSEIYPGIDLVLYGNGRRQLEFDFLIPPGCDPRLIEIDIETGPRTKVVLDSENGILISEEENEIHLRQPVVYQTNEEDSFIRHVGGRYELIDSRRIRFVLDDYDHDKPLVIDPVLVYSTYLGSSGSDSGEQVIVDGSGNAYVAGGMWNASHPTVSYDGRYDAFVAKFSPQGNLVYLTYLGGNNTDKATAIAVDSAGNAFVAGRTLSSNLPTLNAFQPWLAVPGGIFKSEDAGDRWSDASTGIKGRYTNAIVFDPSDPQVAFAATGGGVFKTKDGGNTWQAANTGLREVDIRGIAIDRLQRSTVYAAIWGGGVYKSIDGGQTWQAASSGLGHSLVKAIVVDPESPATVYAGTWGGGVYKSIDGGTSWRAASNGLPDNEGATAISVIAIDPTNTARIYIGSIGGVYGSLDGGTTWKRASSNAHISGLAFKGRTLYALTGLGLARTDDGENWVGLNAAGDSLAIDPSGAGILYVASSRGIFRSSDAGGTWVHLKDGLPTLSMWVIAAGPRSTLYTATETVFQWNGFVAKLTPNGSSLLYSTYLGGQDGNSVFGIALDKFGSAYVTGSTTSYDFPVRNAFQPNCKRSIASGYCNDAFVSKLSPSGTDLEFSTYVGGGGWDDFLDIAVDIEGSSAWVTGATTSADFPVVNPLYGSMQDKNCTPGYSYCVDAVVAKFSASGSLLYSTYFGGSDHNSGRYVKLDAAGNVYLRGNTESQDFPIKDAIEPSFFGSRGTINSFLSKFDPSGRNLIYSTYLSVAGGGGLAIDQFENVYMGGALLAKLHSSGSKVIYRVPYFLGSDTSVETLCTSIAVDEEGNVWATGYTGATTFPTTPDAVKRRCGTDGKCNYNPRDGSVRVDAFVAKIDNVIQVHFPLLVSGEGITSKLTLGNSSRSETARAVVNLLTEGGGPLPLSFNGGIPTDHFELTIPPLASRTLVTSGRGPTRFGSVRVDSNIPLAGTIQYVVPGVGNTATASGEDGVWLLLPVRNGFGGWNTSIALTNPLSRGLELLLVLRNEESKVAPNGIRAITLSGYEQAVKTIEDLFFGVDLTHFVGTLGVFTATTGGSVTAVAIHSRPPSGALWAFPAVTTFPIQTNRQVRFPLVTARSGMNALLLVINPSTQIASGKVVFYEANGVARPDVEAAGFENGSFSIVAWGIRVGSIRSDAEFSQGSAHVIASSPVVAWIGYDAADLGSAVIVGSRPVPEMVLSVRKSLSERITTGIAIAAGGAGTVVTVTLRDSLGGSVLNGQVLVRLPPNGQVAKFIEELFPEAKIADFDGTVIVTSEGGDVTAVALQVGLQAGGLAVLPGTAVW